MIDYLTMMLSTDWFLPHWPMIGIDVEESARVPLKQGFRELVLQMMGGVDSYYLINFSRQRKEETRAEFVRLVTESGQLDRFSEAIQEWTDLTHEELTATWVFTRITRELLAGRLPHYAPALEQELLAKIQSFILDPLEDVEFSQICADSRTKWDRYTRTLEPSLPGALADVAISAVRERNFNLFWNKMSMTLSVEERYRLVDWYRATVRFRGDREDLIPRCMCIYDRRDENSG
ncbi:hypothetical protein [Occallatibacter riparius]|uniref:Uncharacterized protein n=1 Tax=Occallatibacter riparius TaxID=1002689 RepID=A0A9J7BWE1_9BACT|nr:hypothetical protein [Occallatibacter riparius]UWZ86825.1 hypothetical protein MOP44_12955 [Occallatibacter riparius]